ncbi:MAG: hypothetical protein EBU52_16065 [Cytophagia bacterium]|nr:hypothetical protein [Cytophagia bacterium]
MKRMFELSHYLVYMIMMGCSTSQVSTSTTSARYTEDLSYLRPTFEEVKQDPQVNSNDTKVKPAYQEPRYAVNEQLHEVLDSIDRINLNKKVVDGFTIQIYAGQKKEDALNTKRTIDSVLPEFKAEMTYVQPTFRIKAGKYYTQLDAQKDYVAVKRHFPNAILVPDKIPVQF